MSIYRHSKKIGFVIIGLFLVLTIYIISLSIKYNNNNFDILLISFPEVGDLTVDGDFTVNGIVKGKIQGFGRDSIGNVIAKVLIFQKFEVYEGYRAFVGDRGVFGERMVAFENGPINETVIPISDTLSGLYYRGVSDLLGKTYKFNDFINEIEVKLDLFLNGTDSTMSAVEALSSLQNSSDRLIISLLNTSKSLDNSLVSDLKEINKLILELQKFSEENRPFVEKNLKDIDEIIKKVEVEVDKIIEERDNINKAIDRLSNSGSNLNILEIEELILSIRDNSLMLKDRAHKIKLLITSFWIW